MNKFTLQSITLLLFIFIYSTASAQYKSVENASEIFVKTNKKVLKSFFNEQDKKIKVLVLPFLNQNQQNDDLSDNIAREVASRLQIEFQGKNNIIIFVKGEFDGENSKVMSGYSTAASNNKYWENLLEKFKPDFCLSGNYSISSNSANQNLLNLQTINIKNYYFDASQGVKMTQLAGCKTIMPSSDKTLNIKTKYFIWASGKGDYYEDAEEEALTNLLSKISSSLQTKFLGVKSKKMGIAEFSKKVMESYQGQLAERIQSKQISEEEGEAECIKYISKDILNQIFDEKEISIKEYLKNGLKAENQLRISDALLNYYRALVLVQTHPNYSKLKFDFGKGAVPMSSGISSKIREVLKGVKFTVANSDKVSDKNINYTINIRYKGKPVQNLEYQYWTGGSYSQKINATNGVGIVEMFGATAGNINGLKCKIEYRFKNKKQEDRAFDAALDVIKVSPFSEAKIKISGAGNKSSQTELAKTMTKEKVKKVVAVPEINSGKGQAGNLTTETAADIISKVTQAIKKQQHATVKSLFTTEGYEMYTKLIKYGKAKIIKTQSNPVLVTMNNRNVYRSVMMQFIFGKQIFIENVNFTFDTNNKISSVAFALSDTAVDDIMKTKWDEFDKYELLSFMENYKTAYQLKNLDYISSIFSENALIIIGHVLKNAPDDIELNKVRYDKLSKSQYVSRLKKSFSANAYVNLRFEESDVKQGKLEHVYGIQLNQIYSSSNYGDNGYLFLLIDLRKPETPLIHVRTWQPEKSPDGKIFGVEDFYFD